MIKFIYDMEINFFLNFVTTKCSLPFKFQNPSQMITQKNKIWSPLCMSGMLTSKLEEGPKFTNSNIYVLKKKSKSTLAHSQFDYWN